MNSFVYFVGLITLWVLFIFVLALVCWGPLIWHIQNQEAKDAAEQELILKARINSWRALGVPCDEAGNPVDRFGRILHGAEVEAHWPTVTEQFTAILDTGFAAPELVDMTDEPLDDFLTALGYTN